VLKVVVLRPGQRTGRNGNEVRLDPTDPLFLDKKTREDFGRHPTELPPPGDKGRAIILEHEVGHFGTDAVDESPKTPNGRNVRDNENPFRRELLVPERRSYGGYPIPGFPHDSISQ
jgi:hypothetical protein